MTIGIDKSVDLGILHARSSRQGNIVDRLNHISNRREKIAQLAEEFESIFLNLVLKTMRESVPKSEFLDGGNAEDIYRSMLDGEYAKQMAGQRQTGLADQIEDFLLRSIEGPIKSTGNPASRDVGLKAYAGQALQRAQKRATIEADETKARPVGPLAPSS